MWIDCDLNCCFRMFRHPQDSNFLTDMFLGDEDDWEIASYYAECRATEKAWRKETSLPATDDWEYIGGGGVPYDCPIYQGLVSPPWEREEGAAPSNPPISNARKTCEEIEHATLSYVRNPI